MVFTWQKLLLECKLECPSSKLLLLLVELLLTLSVFGDSSSSRAFWQELFWLCTLNVTVVVTVMLAPAEICCDCDFPEGMNDCISLDEGLLLLLKGGLAQRGGGGGGRVFPP